MPAPWDIPPAPPSGDAHEDAISMAVGRALTSWEYVEEAYADIFAILVGADKAISQEHDGAVLLELDKPPSGMSQDDKWMNLDPSRRPLADVPS